MAIAVALPTPVPPPVIQMTFLASIEFASRFIDTVADRFEYHKALLRTPSGNPGSGT
jgi:hypothetical protein